MEKAVEAGVNHPPLIRTPSGSVVYTDSQANSLSMVLMGFVEGKSFLELNRAPDAEELQKVLEQAAKINRIDHHPPYLFDSWAIPNIQVMFDKVKAYIKPEDITLIQQAMARYTAITANLLHDPDNPMSLRDKSAMVSDEYSKLNSLTAAELHYIYDYALAGVAMEFMGAHQEKYVNGNDTEETEYWLNLGREELKREFA